MISFKQFLSKTKKPKKPKKDKGGYINAFLGFINKKPQKEKKNINEEFGLENSNFSDPKGDGYKLDESLKKHYHKNHYSFEQRHSVSHYSANGYKSLNKALYQDPVEKHPEHIKKLDDQLSGALKVRTTPHDLHVYTGTKHDLDPKSKEPVKLHLPAYTSTSLRRHTAHGFAQ